MHTESLALIQKLWREKNFWIGIRNWPKSAFWLRTKIKNADGILYGKRLFEVFSIGNVWEDIPQWSTTRLLLIHFGFIIVSDNTVWILSMLHQTFGLIIYSPPFPLIFWALNKLKKQNPTLFTYAAWTLIPLGLQNGVFFAFLRIWIQLAINYKSEESNTSGAKTFQLCCP